MGQDQVKKVKFGFLAKKTDVVEFTGDITLGDFLKEYQGIPYTADIKVNGKIVEANAQLKTGDIITKVERVDGGDA